MPRISVPRSPFIVSSALALWLVGITTTPAQEQPLPMVEPDPVHWAYSALFGTGWYQVADSQSVFVLRIPPRWRIRTADLGDDGQRRIGVDLRLPLTLGLHNLDDLPGIIEPDNFGTVTFTPGVEVEIPINDRWRLRPFVNLGYGREVSNDYSAWIWYTGIKSRFRFRDGDFPMALITNLYWAGYTPSVGPSDDMTGILLGLEGSIPLREWSYRDARMDLDWHVAFTHFSNEPRFRQAAAAPQVISNIMEAGLAFSPRGRKFDLWLWQPDRAGLAIKWDPDGDFTGISFTFSSWFTR